MFNDGDTGWHLAAGQWILDTRSVPHQDPFSFTFRGQAWTAHEWLAEVIMALAYRGGGWAALALLFSLCICALLIIVGRELIRWLPVRYAVVALAALLPVLSPFALARPHVMAWPLLAGWTVVLLNARDRKEAPRLYWALLMLIWANLHASYIFGLMLAGLFALEALIAERGHGRVIIGWGGFGIAALAMAFITPHGIQGFLYPFQVSGMAVLPLILEWRGTQFFEDSAFILLAGAVFAVAIFRRRRLGALRLLLIAGLAWLAWSHARHQAVFAIVSILVVASHVSPRDRAFPAYEDNVAWSYLLGVGLIILTVARLLLPMQRTDGATFPVSAISRIPETLRKQPVLNSYGFGGPLILNGIAPYIDGRADMYGDKFVIEHQQIVRGDSAAFEQARRRWDLRWTILSPQTSLVAVLDRDPRWRRLYADRWAVVHVLSTHQRPVR